MGSGPRNTVYYVVGIIECQAKKFVLYSVKSLADRGTLSVLSSNASTL